jgi:hypothetical protein
MDFDDFDDDCDEYDDVPDEFTLEQLEWHENIFKFINPDNMLYIPDQHFLI